MLGSILAFIGGGVFGMVGMAVLACYAKKELMLCNRILNHRVAFLEEETEKIRRPVKDPRPRVHALVN